MGCSERGRLLVNSVVEGELAAARVAVRLQENVGRHLMRPVHGRRGVVLEMARCLQLDKLDEVELTDRILVECGRRMSDGCGVAIELVLHVGRHET